MANLSNINNKFIVETDGDIGIGVTTALTKLHIGGTAPGDSIIRQDSTVSGTNWEIGERAAGKWQIFEDDGDTIVATFMSTGNVGIGTPSPSNLLDIKSNGSSKGLDIHHSNGNMVAQLIHGGSGDEGQLKLYDSNVETVKIAGETGVDSFINSGKVGIGDTSPQGKLEVNNRNTATGAALFIKGGEDDLDPVAGQYTGLAFGYGGGDIYNNAAILWEFTNTAANGKLHFAVNPTGGDGTANLTDSKMTILDSGNVGIGTTSPGFATIDGYTQLGIEIKGAKESGTAPVIRLYETGSGKGAFEIRSNRNASTSGNYLAFGESADTFMVIRADDDGGGVTTRGNVGIGTTSPEIKLDVQGSLLLNQWGYASGNRQEEGIFFRTGFTASNKYNSSILTYDFNGTGNTPEGISINGYDGVSICTGSNARNERMRVDVLGIMNFSNTAGGTGTGGSIAHYTNNYMYIKGGTSGLAIGDDGFDVSIYLNNSDSMSFQTGNGTTKLSIASNGLMTQTMDSTTSASTLWSQGVPTQNVWYTVFTYSQYDSVCFFAMVSFENDAGDGANQAAMFATSAGAAYGAAFGVQQISGGTGIEARRSSTSFQVRQTIGAYTSSTRLNVRFISIN